MVANLGWFDWFCFGLVLLSCLIGCWRGLAFEMISLLAWAGAFFAAQWGSVLVDAFWPWQWLANNAQARYLLSFVLVFIVALLLLGLCASAARSGMKKTGLRPFGRVLGMSFGLLRAVLLLWALTVVFWLTPLHQALWWQTSYSAPWLNSSLRTMSPWLPVSLRQWLPPTSRGVHAEYSLLLS